ncbi:MAG TPA: hypothetical protein VF223_10075 [Trebonia sp.]
MSGRPWPSLGARALLNPHALLDPWSLRRAGTRRTGALALSGGPPLNDALGGFWAEDRGGLEYRTRAKRAELPFPLG